MRTTPKHFNALPPYFGGKRKLIPWISKYLEQVLSKANWSNLRFVDAFAGGCSISMWAKTMGFKEVHSNDWSARSQIVFNAILRNSNQYLLKEDLLWLTQPLPAGESGFVEQSLVPHVFSTRHAQALDRIWYWANQFQDETKKNLGLLLLWHLVHEYVCMPTSINTSNRPYSETLDGLRDWQDINPKRFLDDSFPRLLKPKWSKLETLWNRINTGIFGGSPVTCYRKEATEFIQAVQGDILYLDPPYPGTLSYESSLKTLDSVLIGKQPEQPVSPFSRDTHALTPLLGNAVHIPM